MRLLLLLLAAATAFAQSEIDWIEPGRITINTMRMVAVVPDQVVYQVVLRTDAAASLSDATGRLTGTGITAANLRYLMATETEVSWTFELVVPFSKMKATSATLAQRKQQLGQVDGEPALSVEVSDHRTSPEAAEQACPMAALISDARKEAERIAAGAGVHVGAIVGLSDTPNTLRYQSGAGVPGSPPWTNWDPPAVEVSSYTGCRLTVQFRLAP